jgi:pimeloyl-ACP methyl ester carboxylesterase
MGEVDAEIRGFLQDIAKKRRMPDFFDRFEPDRVVSGNLELHLDVIEVDRKRPTVVFMPGTNAYAVLYGEFLAALADGGYNIVGFDPRGHRSPGCPGMAGGDLRFAGIEPERKRV